MDVDGSKDIVVRIVNDNVVGSRLMSKRTPAASLQRRRIYRWVAAVGLLATAEDQSGADVPETNAMGLMGAHAACEAMLGLIVGPLPFVKGQPATERYFPVLLELAAAAAKPRLSQALRGELVTMHHVRNAFVHGGTTVDANELDRAIDAAHALAEHVPLPGNRNLVGVATVVADIIEMDAIGMWLRHADEQRAKGNLRWSADGIARALDAAISRTDPVLRTRTGRRSITQVVRELKDISSGLGLDRVRLCDEERECGAAEGGLDPATAPRSENSRLPLQGARRW
jgi:hypothetical protein